jgi:uncharacterized BrkB/YihY/UPF0761 family membrane protein
MKRKMLDELKSQSTWKLLGLMLITLGLYAAYYMKRQTRIINEYYEHEDKISEGFITFILIICYTSLLFFIASFFVDESHTIAKASYLLDRITNVSFIVWGYKARNRMNTILSAQKETINWFHGLWTFLLSPLYFNFKINKLNEETEHGSDSDD